MQASSRLPDVLRTHETEILADWMRQQLSTPKASLMREGELREQGRTFIGLLREALDGGAREADVSAPAWAGVRDFLTGISRSRTRQGFTSADVATFIFDLKVPLFARLPKEIRDPATLGEEICAVSQIVDRLGLYAIEVQQKAREEVISRQQQELLELSTPVVKLWHGILALPLIGTLDSARTQVVMESLLDQIVKTGSDIAIIDITGVPTVDTLVAQHLMKTIAAARLMGADCIISGVRPQIAQTIVHLGVELNDVITKATLADAFRIALRRTGQSVQAAPQAESGR